MAGADGNGPLWGQHIGPAFAQGAACRLWAVPAHTGDGPNLDALRAMAPAGSTAQVGLFLGVARGGGGRSLRDPYCGGVEDFFDCWALVWRVARDLAIKLPDAILPKPV